MSQAQKSYQQPSHSAPLLFTTVGGGKFLQCASSDPNCTVIALAAGTKVYLAGAFAFQILYGFVEVDGYLYAPKKYSPSNYNNIAIPRGHFPALFSIRDQLSTELHIERIQSRLREFLNDASKVIAFLLEHRPIAILLIKTETDIASRFIQQRLPLNLFPSIGRCLGNNLYLLNKTDENRYMTEDEMELHLQLVSRHREILQRIYGSLAKQNKCAVFIAGNKGVGKSTLARFLINALNTGTNEQPTRPPCRTFLLDADVGQSEMGPSGCVSLNEIRKPLIGAPFVSQLASFPNSYFFGSNSPAIDFDFYLKLVAHLVQKFHTIVAQEQMDGDAGHFVLVLNTVGWIEDLGYDLMLRMLATVKPSILVNIELNGALNFLVPQNYQQITSIIRREPSGSPAGSEFAQKMSAAQLRHCQSAGYLAPLFTTNVLRLANVLPYRLRFCSTSIYIHPELRHVEDKLMLCALNCAWVALCRIEDDFEKYFEQKHLLNDPSLPSRLELRPDNCLTDLEMDRENGEIMEEDGEEEIIPIERKSLPMLRCFGFGLIRAIHPQRKLFYILTPVEQRVLGQVNVLAYGHCMNTPEMLIFDPTSYEPTPYVVELEHGLQDHHKKFFSPLRPIHAGKRGFTAKRKC